MANLPSCADRLKPSRDRTGDEAHRPAVLFIAQAYPPDPAAVGQHLADVASALARRGYRVVVITADRGYDKPEIRYARSELCDGVEIRRLPFASFGKNSLKARVAGGVLFTAQAAVAGGFLRSLVGVVVSTSPPMGAVGAALVSVIRRVPLYFWAMDLNPDQAVAMGIVRPESPIVRVWSALNRIVWRRASRIVTLDRHMAARLVRSGAPAERIRVVPPWPQQQQHVPGLPAPGAAFRERHGLSQKFVVMYSGNHSPANPLNTLLAAAEKLVDHGEIVFVFVGGGVQKEQVLSARLPNVVDVDYQPLSQLHESLAAADVHVVTMGSAMLGLIHPSKIYGAMAAARPVLGIAPPGSHIHELIEQSGGGWGVEQGDTDGVVSALLHAASLPHAELLAVGKLGAAAIQSKYSRERLRNIVCDMFDPSSPKE